MIDDFFELASCALGSRTCDYGSNMAPIVTHRLSSVHKNDVSVAEFMILEL
jgi:hypothetical protein